MSRLIQLAGGVALAVACAGATARMHQICFEGPPRGESAGYVSTAIFGCAIDSTGTCTIAGEKGLTALSRSHSLSLGVQSAGNFSYFEAPGTTPMTATITFVDNGATVTRSCTVNPRRGTHPNPSVTTPGAVLAGHATPGAVLRRTPRGSRPPASGSCRLRPTGVLTRLLCAPRATSSLWAAARWAQILRLAR